MRYLSFLAAVLASAPAVAAEFTDTIELRLRPGFTEVWQAPRPFKNVILGNPDIVDVVQGQTNQELIIITKPDGGTINIALINEKGEQIANLLVTTATQYQLYQPARRPVTGEWQVYRNDDKCYPVCTKPNARPPTKKGH